MVYDELRGGVEMLSVKTMHEERGDAGEIATPMPDDTPDLIAIDHALCRLDRLDSQWGHIVELRYFCGLSVTETAEALNVSPQTMTARRALTLSRCAAPRSRPRATSTRSAWCSTSCWRRAKLMRLLNAYSAIRNVPPGDIGELR